jgi:glycosyltransferase involved in cell wall biosynthesis
MKLSVIIPAYNEEKRISKTLISVAQFLQQQIYLSEILVVVDGATDNTLTVLKNLQKQILNLKVVENSENHGKGWVVKQGMLEASGDIRVFMDADNSTTINEIKKFLPYFEKGFDIVIGSRRIEGANIAKKQPWVRDLQGSIFRFIVHIFVPLGVTDSQCGFKAFSAKATKQIFSLQCIYRWAFDVEILAIARKFKLKIQEAPVTWVNDEESHVKFSGKIKMLLEVLQIRINLWLGKYGSYK